MPVTLKVRPDKSEGIAEKRKLDYDGIFEKKRLGKRRKLKRRLLCHLLFLLVVLAVRAIRLVVIGDGDLPRLYS